MQDARSPLHDRLCLGSTVAIAILFLAAAVSLSWLGGSARTFGDVHVLAESLPTTRIVRTSAQLYSLWKESGYRGRQVVHASRFLHFVADDEALSVREMSSFPIKTFDLLRFYERDVDARNLLRMAVQAGIARSVHHVLPPDGLDERLAGLAPGLSGVAVRGRRIFTHELGSLRILSDELPELDGPALLAIDASYFHSQTAGHLLRRLRHGSLCSELIALCRAEDNPDVGEAARGRLDELALALGASRP